MNPPATPPRSKQSSLGSLMGYVVVIGLLAIGFTQRQQIIDAYKLYNYTPPAAIEALATQDTLTPQTRRIYYVNQPQLQNKAQFKSECPNGGGEKTIILGCYKGGQNGIHLLEVDDKRLGGVVQVTAAHETLHAVYDRLSRGDRTRIDAMLLNYYNTGLKDDRIKKTIAGYRISEPNDVVNEMHSIFGTEVATLPKELEDYYSKYFTDRSKVIGFANQYQAEFTSRQDAVKAADSQLAQLKQQLSSLESGLSTQQSRISDTEQQLLAKKRSGDTAGYNAGVPGFNALIDNYNQGVAQAQSFIKQYNQVVADRNAVASQIAELSNALSTSNSAQPIEQ